MTRGHDLRIYVPSLPASDLGALSASIVSSGRYGNVALRAYWGQVVLPAVVKRDSLDVFWGPSHRLPPKLPSRLPRVLTIYDLVWKKSPETMHFRTLAGERMLFNSSLRRADVVTTVSTSTADDIAAVFPALRTPVLKIYPGAGAPKSGNADDAVALTGIAGEFALFVGTLEPRKNLPRLLEAYASLPETVRQRCKLVVAGGKGWEPSDLRQLAATLNIGGNVQFLGRVSDQTLTALYRRCRFLVMPSLYEGFGLPIIEANALGAPVLTSNVSSMVEAAGDAGLLVDPHNVASIADGFNRLATDSELRNRLASHARANAARYDWADAAGKFEHAFSLAIDRRISMQAAS